MRRFPLLLLAALCLPLLGTRAGEPVPRLVGAYYYPWYYPARWTNEPVSHLPRGGFYDSGDRATVAQHLAWTRQADIDFLVVSWVSTNGYENRNLQQAVLPELEKTDRRFCLLYETPLALGIPAGQLIDLAKPGADGRPAGELFVAHFDYLADHYLKHPRYLDHAGRAVVAIYLVRDMRNAAPYLERVRERLAGRGISLHLIADAVYWAPPEQLDWDLLGTQFQAVTAYNMYYRTNFLPAVRAQFEKTSALAGARGLTLIPNVMPGYDDTPLRGTERVTIHRRQGRFYAESWQLARAFVSDEQPFVLITSFNEWHEGTELEPSAEFGGQYLDLTRAHISRLRSPEGTPAKP